MLESVKSQMDNLDLIVADFIEAEGGLNYSKEKIVELNKTEKLKLELNYILVAICKNGGLIALCKTRNYKDIFNSSINNNIIIMHQDASSRYLIPIDWNYEGRYIVHIEFNDKEQLFAFCNDGTILRLDIITRKAIPKPTSDKIKDEKIYKAKLFEKGYIVLTEEGTIYLVEDLKEPNPIFIVSIKEQLGFNNDVDFIGIPASISCSGNFEIVITNQKGEGVLHIERQTPKDTRKGTFYSDTKGHKHKQVVVNVINSPKLQEYSDFQTSPDQSYRIGKVKAIAISPSNETIALYASDSKSAFFLSTQISPKTENEISKVTFKISDDFEEKEIREQEKILDYNWDLQLLFCGEDNVAICGGLFTMIINRRNSSVAIRVQDKENEVGGFVYCRGISEVDGLRYITDNEVHLITQVSSEFTKICNPFSKSKSKDLVKAYAFFLSKNPTCNDILRNIGDDLPNATNELLSAASDIYWVEKDPDTFHKRDAQIFLVKAAQFGKSFLKTKIFNIHKFDEICQSIRIINNMRNFPLKTRFITYRELASMDMQEVINKTMRQLNFKLAFQISKFLLYSEREVYLKYAIAKIKKGDLSEDLVYDELMDILKNVENISYIEIAKKCIKYNKNKLAEKFLNKEKSDLVKIPQYLQLKNWDKALELSLKSYDINVIKVVIDKIYKVEELNNFTKILSNFPQAHTAVIDYFKSIGKPDDLDKCLQRQKDKEELFFIALENFFNSKDLQKRKDFLEKAEKCLNEAKNIDYSFYKIYISDLKNSLKFKESCFDEKNKIIGENDIDSFDNSIYDCFEKATPELLPWVEVQNNKYFEISKRKMTVLRFRVLAKNKKFDEIDEIIQKESYKKLEINPLKVADIMFENGNKEKALEYAKKETNIELYEDKFEFLLKLEKYLDAVEAALSEKKHEKKMELVHKVLKLKPQLKDEIEELCDKYKVSL